MDSATKANSRISRASQASLHIYTTLSVPSHLLPGVLEFGLLQVSCGGKARRENFLRCHVLFVIAAEGRGGDGVRGGLMVTTVTHAIQA